jgi:1-acyl-sn-glycerol-3-phosphate acyltransferase
MDKPLTPYFSPGPPPPPPKREVWNTLKSVWIWGGTALLVILWFPLVALTWLIARRDPARRRVSAMVRRLNILVNRVNPLMRIEVEGLAAVRAGQSCVVVCNHQSMTDIPLLARLPLEIKWVAKHVLFAMPFTGWMMRMSGDIPVDTRSEDKKRQVLSRARDYLDRGLCVLFFPEGRRSGDGAVYRFSRGAFELAVAAQKPILPVAIDGLHTLLPMNTWRFGRAGVVRMKVLEPVETRGLEPKDAEWLREQVRFRILEQIAEWRGCDPDEVDGILRNAREQARRELGETPLLI